MSKKIVVGQNEKKLIPIIWTGKENTLDYQIRLVGRGAEVSYLMLLVGTNATKLKLNTTVVHESPNTNSRIIIKGILDNSSGVDFEGLVKINKGAKKSNTQLAAHLLLLSDKAKGRVVPNLEISENEVKAGHAATVGKINEMQLFYLMSRGLSKKSSTKLIIQGFLENIISEFPVDEAAKIRKKLK